MISVDEARAIVLAHARALPFERARLSDALGRTLAEDIVASRAQPPFPASAMDGYALRSADTPGLLNVVGESAAGRGFPRSLEAGEAVRIFTGAPVPDGADAILIQEDATREGDCVRAPHTPSGQHVRRTGVDFAAGARLLETGRVLDGAALALAAAAGCASLAVVRAPRVSILSGGDEIVPPGAEPGPHQIFDSVSYGIAGYAKAWGAAPAMSAPFADDATEIATKAKAALAEADVVIIIGGASVGDHDQARPALASIGAELLFSKVAVRPGKPTWFAQAEGRAILGLPGNPASALVCARLFLRPLLDSMLGRDAAPSNIARHARLRAALSANGPRETYLRAIARQDETGQLWLERLADQDSSLLTAFAAANALILRPPHAPQASAGDVLPYLPL